MAQGSIPFVSFHVDLGAVAECGPLMIASMVPGRVKPMTYTNLYLSLPNMALVINNRIW